MNPEDHEDSETTSSESEEANSPEVFAAEVVEEVQPADSQQVDSPEIVDAALAPAGTSIADVFDSAKTESSLGQPGEQIWQDNISRTALPPRTKACRNSIIAFSIAAIASFVFLLIFLADELQTGRNALIITRLALLVVFVLLGNLAGLFRIQREYVPTDARYSAWGGLAVSIAGFLLFFPSRWSWYCFAWALGQLPPVIANAFAPAKVAGDDIQFDVNDSVAANGGSFASVVLGIWSILGALFTSLSVINSVLGVLLGLWGLSSRKKSVAVLGIVLCLVGVVACMLNASLVFWEMIQIQEEELLQSAQ